MIHYRIRGSGLIESSTVSREKTVVASDIPPYIATMGESTIDMYGNFIDVNESACRRLGYTRDELLRMTTSDIDPDRHTSDIEDRVEEVHRNGHTHFRTTHVTKAGVGIPVELSCSLIDYGSTKAILSIARDISEREKVVKALVESEARYRELFDSVMEGICIVDENENIRFCNPAFADILEEESLESLTGRNLFDFIPDSAKKIVSVQTSMRKKNISSQYELELETAKGNRRYILASVSPRLDENGDYGGAFGTLYDITDRRNAEEAVRKTRDELEIRVKLRTAELETEREILERKNTALKEVLNHIETEKQQIAEQLQTNIDRLVYPLIRYLQEKAGADCEQYISVIKASLADITSPFLASLESKYVRLTRRELEICNMIRNGFSSKEIATALGSAEQTVLKQRTSIRRKLGISGKDINLSTFLRRMKQG